MSTTTETETVTSPPTASFPDIAPFPTSIPTAPLLRLSLSALRSDPAESARLFQACKDLGFFYLDLQGDELGQELLRESDALFRLSRKLFDIGRDDLQKYDYSEQGSYYGYKGFGKGVVDRKGTLDRNEFYNSGKDDFLGQSQTPFAHPTLLTSSPNNDLLKSYMIHAHTLINLILQQLNTHLRLPPNTLSYLHAQSRISGDHVRMIKAPPQELSNLGPSMGAHTDFGSVTVLMNRVGGLQVLPPDSSEWVYVRPLPGHTIINLGDALVKFSNGLLRSNIHRVVSPPGEQANETRYSLVYFARPADDVLLKRLDGEAIPPLEEGVVEEDVCSKDWIRDKALSRRTVGFGKVGAGKNRETGRLGEGDA